MELLDKETLDFVQTIIAFVVVIVMVIVMMGIGEGFKWLQCLRDAHIERERKIIDMSVALTEAIVVIRHEIDNGRFPSLLNENPHILTMIRD